MESHDLVGILECVQSNGLTIELNKLSGIKNYITRCFGKYNDDDFEIIIDRRRNYSNVDFHMGINPKDVPKRNFV